MDYNSFGQRTTDPALDEIDHLFGFTGRPLEKLIQLQENRDRWYKAATGIWISEDPVGFLAGDGNLIRYVRNSPLTQIDPSGLRPPPVRPGPTRDPVIRNPAHVSPRLTDADAIHIMATRSRTLKAAADRCRLAGVPEADIQRVLQMNVVTVQGDPVDHHLRMLDELADAKFGEFGARLFEHFVQGLDAPLPNAGDSPSRASLLVPQPAAAGAGKGGHRRGWWGDVQEAIARPNNPGRVDYGALDALGRPTGVIAIITPGSIGRGTDANQKILPPGFQSGVNYARAHLYGRQLGGSGDVRENLVTFIHNPANSPVMRGLENSIRKAVEAGEIVVYRATPIYKGNEPIPLGITIEAVGNRGFFLFTSVRNVE